jgi:hypothetical protein
VSDDSTVSPEYAYTKLVTKVKRGTGTRDQDTTKVVTRHPEPGVAVHQHGKAVDHAHRLAQEARDMQPAEEEGDG